MRVELEPETVHSYHAERRRREQRINTSESTLHEVHEMRYQAQAFTRTAPGNDLPTPAMMAAKKLAEQQAAALRLALEQSEALEKAKAAAQAEARAAEAAAAQAAAERAQAEAELREVRRQNEAIALATRQAETLVEAHEQAQARALAHINLLAAKDDARRMALFQGARERAIKSGLMKEPVKVQAVDQRQADFEGKVASGSFRFGDKTPSVAPKLQAALAVKPTAKASARR